MAELFEFPPQELEDRFVDHWAMADEYRLRLETEFQVKTELQVRRLYLTVISAYKDIERYKNFHLDDPFRQRSDAVKRVSYLAKWLCRFKPLIIMEADGDLDNISVDRTTLVNELFALHLAVLHLSVDVGRDFNINQDKAYELAYEMLYRHLSEDSYMLFFQMIRDLVSNGREVVMFV